MNREVKDNVRRKAAAVMTLPVEQIRFYDELTAEQVAQVEYLFSHRGNERYIYGVKRSGDVVSHRELLTGGVFAGYFYMAEDTADNQ